MKVATKICQEIIPNALTIRGRSRNGFKFLIKESDGDERE